MTAHDRPSQFVELLKQFGMHFPLLAVYAAGVVLALAWLRRGPRPALLVLIGSGLLLLTTVFMVFWYALLPSLLVQRDLAGGDVLHVFTLSNVCHIVLNAIGAGFLIAAAFIGRSPPQTTRPASPA